MFLLFFVVLAWGIALLLFRMAVVTYREDGVSFDTLFVSLFTAAFLGVTVLTTLYAFENLVGGGA